MSTDGSRHGSLPQKSNIAIVVNTQNPLLIQESNLLAQKIDSDETGELTLYFGDRGIELKESSKINQKGQRVDFYSIISDKNNRSKKQPLPRAIGNNKTVIDATAGFGVDTCRLAVLGYETIGVEKSPILSSMLRDGLHRVLNQHSTPDTLERTMQFVEQNSIDYLKQNYGADVVYIDPMFPPKKKKSALPPGRIQMLQSIVGYENEEDTWELFEAALNSASSRVVVKRPHHCETMLPKPTAVHKGKLIRYEVYVP